eukprot:5717842-Prymnesium_polylepis.1
MELPHLHVPDSTSGAPAYPPLRNSGPRAEGRHRTWTWNGPKLPRGWVPAKAVSVCKFPAAQRCCTRQGPFVYQSRVRARRAALLDERLAVRVLGKRRRRVASCGASPLSASRRARA